MPAVTDKLRLRVWAAWAPSSTAPDQRPASNEATPPTRSQKQARHPTETGRPCSASRPSSKTAKSPGLGERPSTPSSRRPPPNRDDPNSRAPPVVCACCRAETPAAERATASPDGNARATNRPRIERNLRLKQHQMKGGLGHESVTDKTGNKDKERKCPMTPRLLPTGSRTIPNNRFSPIWAGFSIRAP